MATASEEFLVRFRYSLVERRHDHPQRLRDDDQPQRRAAPQAERGAASVCPWLTDRMPARTISAMKAAV